MMDDIMSDTLDDILCSRINKSRSTKQEQIVPTAVLPRLSNPLAVTGLGRNMPVILEDPVRFRKDIQTMVMAQMLSGIPDDDQMKRIKEEGSMIEIATVVHMVKAAEGDLDCFKYIMDRVLGKPVSQTNTVSMTISYEQMLDNLDPDEIIEPKKVFCEEV